MMIEPVYRGGNGVQGDVVWVPKDPLSMDEGIYALESCAQIASPLWKEP